MKISVFSPVFADKSLESMLAYLSEKGITSLELGTGGYPGTVHANALQLIENRDEVNKINNLLMKYNISISALSVHGNAVHPNKKIAELFENDYKATLKLAQMMNVDTVVTFSGCPGDSHNAINPNWVVCAWPDDFAKVLNFQWNEILIPYWENAVKQANCCGVSKIALEMHPGFNVYNPESLMRLRNAVGDTIGANFDPSHLIWQGMNPVYALKYLLSNNAVYHFHAKDTRIDPMNTAINGVLDNKPYTNEAERAWVFRTIGYGCNESVWNDMMSMLSVYSYKGAVSIEHEDSLMTPMEGLDKAINFLKKVIISEDKPNSIHWA